MCALAILVPRPEPRLPHAGRVHAPLGVTPQRHHGGTRLEISQMRTYNLIAGLIMLVVAVAAGLWIANNVV